MESESETWKLEQRLQRLQQLQKLPGLCSTSLSKLRLGARTPTDTLDHIP